MKQKLITLLLLLAISTISAQNICGKVNYTINAYGVGNYQMTFNNNVSYNEQINLSKDLLKDKEEISISENGNQQKDIIIGQKSLLPAFMYNNQKDFYFNHEYLDGEIDVIKEDKKIWTWKILPETKKIGNFTCQKAEATFRGSVFTAWFTNKIPVPFGPWKAKDLPGLILELYDGNKITHMIATKVTLSNKEKCVIPFDEKVLEKAVSIDTYLVTKRKKKIEYFEKVNAKLPKGAKQLRMTENCDDCPKEVKLENFNEGN